MWEDVADDSTRSAARPRAAGLLFGGRAGLGLRPAAPVPSVEPIPAAPSTLIPRSAGSGEGCPTDTKISELKEQQAAIVAATWDVRDADPQAAEVQLRALAEVYPDATIGWAESRDMPPAGFVGMILHGPIDRDADQGPVGRLRFWNRMQVHEILAEHGGDISRATLDSWGALRVPVSKAAEP